MANKSTQYLGATADPNAPAEHGLPEFAIAGRSNVGKSTLLNTLVNERVARTSRTPGRTQLLHFVAYRKHAVLVDLPGLGYAKAPRAVQKKIQKMATHTVRYRASLRGLLLLVDIRRKPGDAERALLEYARECGLRVLLIATKADQVPKHRRKPALEGLRTWSGLNREQTVAVSTQSGEGVEAIHRQLEIWARACQASPDEEPAG